ncbi:MAG: Acyl-coenzyme A thioesterase 9, mitochondrial [Cirrosporium novae-zelandiae]|nr:MAG: Acyl-coenzyme A thioesterase 9, mitochondrial [Cirrosporium novae-zelandiae]
MNPNLYSELTSMRVKTPYIKALEMQREQKESSDTAKTEDAGSKVEHQPLQPRRMSDSYLKLVIPFAEDPWLLDNYLNATGHIRNDLDALAGAIAYKHAGNDEGTIVTAAVDRITIKYPLKQISNLELSGQVTFASGGSSMEITLQVARAPQDDQEVKQEDVVMNCVFTMVSLDPKTKKPVPTNPLEVVTDAERRIYEHGKKNYLARKAMVKNSLDKIAPNEEEFNLIHKMWLEHDLRPGRNTHQNWIPMAKAVIKSTQIMQPQYRNRHNFMIFGGFLMRHTYELAFCCIAAACHTRPTFISLDPSTFENPVPVGSVLYLKAGMAYSEPIATKQGEEPTHTRVQVRVSTFVRDVAHEEYKSTGQFNYTFLVDKVVSVIPRSYSEFMVWVDAKRRVQRVASIVEREMEPGVEKLDDGSEDRVTE